MKLGGFGHGPSGPSPEELEKEAAAELRRAMAGSERRPPIPARRGMPSDWMAEQSVPDADGPDTEAPDSDGPGWRQGLNREDERRAVTDLAMQQLTERPNGKIRPEDTVIQNLGVTDAEDMRNRALADFLERQQRLARERPAAPPSARPAVVQKTSGVTISPRLTVSPTMTGAVPGVPSLGSRSAQPAPATRPAGAVGAFGARATPTERPSAAPPSALLEVLAPVAGSGSGISLGPHGPGDAAPLTPGAGSRPARPPSAKRTAVSLRSSNSPDQSSPTTAARRRPVQRSEMARTTVDPSEGENRWRVLAELADRLAKEVFPADTLPEISRWLAATLDAKIAIVLLADGAVDYVAAWPADDPLAAVLGEQVGQPLDERSTVWAAVADERSIAGQSPELLVLPDGTAMEDPGGWAVVPLVARTVAFGALLVARERDECIPEAMVYLVEDVAQRVARALLNCEEAVSSGSTNAGGGGDPAMPAAIRDRLAALALVLEAIEALPRPPLAGGDEERYRQVADQAATLESTMQGFLTGEGGGSR